MGEFPLAEYDDGSFVHVVFNDSNRRVTDAVCVNNGAIPSTAAGIRGYLQWIDGTVTSQTWAPNPGVRQTVALPAKGATVVQVNNEPGDPPGTHLELRTALGYGIEVLG
jgi:hypothetical protein